MYLLAKRKQRAEVRLNLRLKVVSRPTGYLLKIQVKRYEGDSILLTTERIREQMRWLNMMVLFRGC